jgi:hypothetical protein
VWEYARESRTLRGATSFDKFEQTNEIKWLAELCDELGPCDCPWLEAVADYKEHIRQLLNSDLEEGKKPFESITLPPITLSDCDPDPVILLTPGQEPPPGWLKMGINPDAPRSDIYKALEAAGIGTAKRSYEKVTDWKARLEALGTLRLKRHGCTYPQIARKRLQSGWSGNIDHQTDVIRRHIKTAADYFQKAFPFLSPFELTH